MLERSPYIIRGPAQICVSGGRTSGYMLYQILEANGGIPDNCFVTFQNTGKELEQTLVFIEEMAKKFGVDIIWLEWNGFIPPKKNACYYRTVDFETASRNGEPFDKLTTELSYLPNPTQRLCTANLKIKTGEAFMRSQGFERWDNVVGIRYDEPKRVARMRSTGRNNGGGDPVLPLAGMGITKKHVGEFWEKMPFDLKLLNNNGTTPQGNCDLCFLKGKNQILSLIRENPSLADWWINQEKKIEIAGTANGECGSFRSDRPTYAQMLQFALSQKELFPYDHEPIIDCMCGGGD